MTSRARSFIIGFAACVWLTFPSTASASGCLVWWGEPTVTFNSNTYDVQASASAYLDYWEHEWCWNFQSYYTTHAVRMWMDLNTPYGNWFEYDEGYSEASVTITVNAGDFGFGPYFAQANAALEYFDGYNYQQISGGWLDSNWVNVNAPNLSLSPSGGDVGVNSELIVFASVPSSLGPQIVWSGCAPDYTGLQCVVNTAFAGEVVVSASLGNGDSTASQTYNIVP